MHTGLCGDNKDALLAAHKGADVKTIGWTLRRPQIVSFRVCFLLYYKTIRNTVAWLVAAITFSKLIAI